MDKIALRKLVDVGVARIRAAHVSESPSAREDITEVVLDRLIQAGQIALTYEEPWFLNEVIRGLLESYKLTLFADADTMRPDPATARRLFLTGSRVWILGAEAVRLQRFDAIRAIVLQRPVDRLPLTYWMRYTVTTAARAEIGVFRGQSIISPVSESIRAKPQFFAAFDSNLDVAVNASCQFDFLACILVIAETKRTDDVYPNFGGYYSERTLPIIEDVISGGKARAVVKDISNEDLAEILYKLNQLTAHAFFGVHGWDGYNERIQQFISKNGGDRRGDR